MSTIQERLQLKRVPLDTWNIREQLCLASAVVRSGDQNWMSVSRALKTVGEANRPADWYSQKSCAAQYGVLLEHVETPKRKKRSSEGAVETPQESILKRLTQERTVEIQKTLAEMNQQYDQLKTEITEGRNPSTSEDRLRELLAGIEAGKRAREREQARRATWLKEREERRARADRTWRPPQSTTPTSPAAPATPSSPLLTSLLKSSPVVTTPQHISHPANVVETISPSATAPTLSMLLEKSATTTAAQNESKHAAIEHIKSQLVQIEQQLIASTSVAPTSTIPLAPVAPSVDIDDIEIKAEDVYAFRDIDIHIPPVTTMHKAAARVAEKQPSKNEDSEATPPVVEATPSLIDESVNIKEETVNEEEVIRTDESNIAVETIPEPSVAEPVPEQTGKEPEPEVRISFPKVKFPTPEIKVINSQADEQKIKEEVKEPETVTQEPVPEPKAAPEPEVVEEITEVTQIAQEEIPEPTPEIKEEIQETPAVEDIIPPPPIEVENTPTEESQEETQDPVQEDETPETVEAAVDQEETPPLLKEDEQKTENELEESTAVDTDAEELKKDDDAEDSIPLKEMIKEEGVQEDTKILEDTHTETDDDTPMELSREEEKDGKKRRDYSRKKKSDSRTCSGSESAPESPSASDAERRHRLWKKSVMLVYSRLCAHKYASLFLRPISDEEAPGYSLVVKRPMDLTAIRRNIDNGVIRTTAEFQRDVLLMLSNALMYNSSEHSVYAMAKEMHEEAQCQLGMLLAAQAHAGLSEPTPGRRKRRRVDSPPPKRT